MAKKAKGLVPTKRNVLSILAGLYDPLGLASPLVVTSKILLQELWKEGFGWDDELDEIKKERWVSWIENLERAREFTLPRCVYGQLSGQLRCSLHGFADASMKAYCAVIYFVSELNGENNVELLTSKTRVAPSKSHTIPRLELMSGRILAKLMSSVRLALENEVEILETYFWLDSKTALCWIYNKGEWKQFVRHRVNEILSLSRKESWSHCPGDDNPADIGSRGMLPSKLKSNMLWWKGPGWLTGPKCGWPVKGNIVLTSESQEEAKGTVVLATGFEHGSSVESVIDIHRFSSLCKLLRITSLVIRFVNNLKAKVEKREMEVGILKPQELSAAENALVKAAQASLKKTANYQQLVKQLGLVERDGILRCKGRLENADLSVEAREPVILPKDHWLTVLMVRACHQRVHHCGLRASLSELRQRFWVPRGRQIVKKVISKCVICKRVTSKAYNNPTVASLPDFRVKEAPAFSKVGVDFAGPLYAKDSGDMVKVYIALFTCCITRAIYLDL